MTLPTPPAQPARPSQLARVLACWILLFSLGLADAPPKPHLRIAMQGGRPVDVPRRISDLRRDLSIGQLWLVESAKQPLALRASLESGNRIVAALTLDPSTGFPVALAERGNYRPLVKPSASQLSAHLKTLRGAVDNLRLGVFVIPAQQGYELQVYWQSKLVSYLYVNPNSFEVNTDQASSEEVRLSAVRVR